MDGLDVVAEASTGEEAVALSKDLVPDVVLMDIKMPGTSGIEATRQVVKENPHIGVILITMFDDHESVFSGMRAGAKGYVLKEAEPDELRRAIDAAYRGEVILSPIIATKVLAHFGDSHTGKRRQPLPYEELTDREHEVFQLAADRLNNRYIDDRLVISEKTVKNHIANIFSKLQVNDRTQAVLYGLRKGLVSISPDDD
jgi:two-component system NarL family response regulator